MTGEQTRPLNSYAIGAFVYAEQDGKLLRLKRAGGAHTGAWSLPGGAKVHGESPEEAAVRELMEETRLAPSSALELIGVAPVQVYGIGLGPLLLRVRLGRWAGGSQRRA